MVLNKTRLRVTQFSVARNYCGAIDQSGARKIDVMGFLGRVRYNIRTNELDGSVIRMALDSIGLLLPVINDAVN